MWEDPIVNEVRKIREGHAAQFNYNLQAIYAVLKEAEQKSRRKKVTFPPKWISSVKKAKQVLSR